MIQDHTEGEAAGAAQATKFLALKLSNSIVVTTSKLISLRRAYTSTCLQKYNSSEHMFNKEKWQGMHGMWA